MAPVFFHFTHKAPQGTQREVRFQSLLPEGLIRVEALDGQKPAWLHIPPKEFPWRDFSHFLIQAWQASRNVPFAFRPERRIPLEVLEALMLPGVTDAQALEILRTLRKNHFFPAIRQESAHPQS